MANARPSTSIVTRVRYSRARRIEASLYLRKITSVKQMHFVLLIVGEGGLAYL